MTEMQEAERSQHGRDARAAGASTHL